MPLNRKKAVKWALVLIGLAMIVFFGGRARESYRQLQYLHEQGFDTGDAEVNAIRPWMTVHFVAAAYAVPEDYIFARLGLKAALRDRDIDVEHLNRELRLGQSADGPGPAVIDRLRDIILAYRANPVATGLADVRDWMTLSYIVNSTGIPADTLVIALWDKLDASRPARPAGVSLHKPLTHVAADLGYPGGPERLCKDLQSVIRQHERDEPDQRDQRDQQ